ncbi:uncharacterized protein LOC123563259 isoform X3 [Mercenaria mercenaria]|uniref:uncharacterized protein LOC123563259 isoform X3 n=1 Tax=Mercenaria mercenaria TaxID=6596 RepID=UPI00234F2591|nr:uncharacterized protein LOC123563259 isoform X3 [Mercenaria mercenaria]
MDPEMKTLNVNGHVRAKWSIRECDENSGWKLKDVRRKQVKAESLDGVKIIRELYTTNFDSKFDDRYWRVGDIHLIENDKLQSQFEEYKKELIELGRPSDTIKETLAFSAESEKSCKDICQEGYKVGSKKRHVLGHTGSGVHLVRHYDILTRYMMFQQYTSPAYIVVYKTFLGKSKPIVPRLHKDDNYVPPYMGFDSHVSARHIDKEMPICEALNCSYVYLYEFDPIASNPVKHPRQILPYVIIQLEKKNPCVPENPFLTVGTDETRSTWEVKGETRRGFRFMFTKSGLKGKHKVFSKGCNRANIGSYLKGQILEMRTKSAGSVSEVKPPLLQKIDESSIIINSEGMSTSKPPHLQKFSKSYLQSPSKKKSFIFSKEIENLVIPDTLREIRQLSNLKPCVKLKRLDSVYLKGATFRIKNGNENSNNKDSVKTKANFEANSTDNSKLSSSNEDKGKDVPCLQKSETERTVSTHCENGKNGPTLISGGATIKCKTNRRKTSKEPKTNETHIGFSSSVNSDIVPESRRRSTEKTMTETTCDKFTDKIESLTPKANKTTDQTLSKILDAETQIRVRTTAKILDEYKKTTNTVADKTELLMRKDKSLHMCSKNDSYNKQASFCVKPSQNEVQSTSNDIANDIKVNPSVQKCAGASSLTRDDSAVIKESKNNPKLPGKNYKTDKGKLETGDSVDLLKKKSKLVHKHELDRSLPKLKTYSRAAKLRDLRLRDAKEKSPRNKTDVDKADKKRSAHRKENQCDVCPEKEKQRKGISSRCYPTKTKFGMIAYTVNKSKARSGKYVKGKYRSDNILKQLEKGKTDMQTKEYDFHAPNIFPHKEHSILKPKPGRVTRDCSDNDDKASKSYKNSNESMKISSPSGDTGQSELITANKQSNRNSVASAASFEKHTDASSNNLARNAKIVEPDHHFKKQSQNQTQRMVLEKSKSPVVANAAPDILNISPFPISAQTSTCSISDSTVTVQNESVNIKSPTEKQKQTDVYQETDLFDKSNFFFSEMSSFYGKTEKVQTIELIEQFPDSFNHNIVVNPVLRVTPNAELPTLAERKKSRSKKRTSEQTQRDPDNDANMKPTVPGTSPQHNEAPFGMEITHKSSNLAVVGKKDNKNTTPLSKQSMIAIRPLTNTKNDSSKAADKLFDVSTSQSHIITPMIPPDITEIPTVPSAQGKDAVRKTSTNKTTGVKEAQSKLRSKQGSKCKRSKSAGKDENKNIRKSKDKNVPSVKTSVIDIIDSSNSTEKSDLFHFTCSDQNSLANSDSDRSNRDKIDSCRQQKLLENFEQKTENKVSNTNEEVKKPRKKQDEFTKEKTETRISSVEKEIMTEYNQEPKTPGEQQQHVEMSDNANVKVNTFAADKFRSFLNSTAAVALQHRKSVDQKSDTEIEDTSSNKQNPDLESPITNYDTEFKTSLDQKSNTVGTNGVDSKNRNQNHKSPKPNPEEKTKGCCNSQVFEVSNETNLTFSEKPKDTSKKSYVHSQDASKTKNTETLLKQPKNTFIKHNTRIDSAEMHDSDSQDTVIGGVRDSPLRHFTSVTSSQEHLKYVDTVSTKVKHSATQPKIACNIKQEKVADGYQDEIFPNDKAKFTDSASESHPQLVNENILNIVGTYHVNQLSSDTLNTDKRHDELMSNNEIKQEPIDQVSDATPQLTSTPDIGTQPMKVEPCSPTCIFPKTRRELAKGTAMLDATECRSAIVDTLKELSSVLKFLTENNNQSPKQTEKVALVAKRMCNVLSCESTTEASKTDESLLTKDLTSNDLHIKTEPIDTEYSKIMEGSSQRNLKSHCLTPGDSFCRSEREENHRDNECPSGGNEFKYEYIIKSSGDEYRRTCESVAAEHLRKETMNRASHNNEPLPNNDHIASKDYSVLNETSQHRYLGPSSETVVELLNQHEKDELPRLFDPNEEPDISCLEQFGIPKELRRNNTEATKHTEFLSSEKPAADNNTNTAPPENILMKEIKTEKGTDCMTIKSKPKQHFNLKTGVLNKGLKERKNMFDLKINASRRKTAANIKPVDRKFSVTPKIQITQKSTSQKCVLEKTEQNNLAKVENPSYLNYHEETDGIMNEVYKTVCEKLSTLKESCILEHDDSFPLGLTKSDSTKINECKSSINSDTSVPSKDIQPQPISGDSKNENDMSAVKVISPKEEVKKANTKKQAPIPFHTVLKLKRQQFWKYKRGETNKKFIDYKELFSKMSSRRQDKSYGKPLDVQKNQNTYSKQTSSGDISKSNENLGKKLNYFIPSSKTSAISERGTALIEDNKSKELLPETVNLKRNISDADEGNSSKRIKFSSGNTERKESDSNRSRSRSSPRSSTSRNRSDGYSSSSSGKHKSSNGSRKCGDYSVRPSRPYSKFSHNIKPVYAQRTYFNGRGSYRPYPARLNQNLRSAGRSSFNKSGTGYFSWRRKYQPQRNVFDGFVVTDRGSVQTMSEYAEWNRFKERETLRDQIEIAIKEYRRTFENTPDDFKGDEKVASYLSFLTEKLDKIQSKRDKLSMVETNEERRSKHRRSTSSEKVPSRSPQPRRENESHLFRKLEKSQNFHQHETQKHSSVTRFSGSLASDSDSLSYKQRRHASGIEELLKEHIAKHCEHLTKQIKQEMVDLKTTKSGSTGKEHKDSSYHSDSHRKKYGDDKYRRHSRERYDSSRTRKGESSRHGGEYSKDYHGSKDKPYDRKYYKHPQDKYDKGKYSYHRMGRDDKYDNKCSYGDKYERRQDSFRNQHSRNYGPRYDKDYYSNSKYHREYEAGNFDDNIFGDEVSRNDTDRNHDRGPDYRKTYDYQQNFDRYQEKLQEEHGTLMVNSFRQNHYDGNIRKRLGLRNIGQYSKAYQPKHWFRGKYRTYFNKGSNDSKNVSEERNENESEADTESVQDEFDATQYRQFIPTSRGYNKRGRGFLSGINKSQPAYKQHYQPAKFSKFRNPATYFFHGDEDTGKDNKNENKKSDSVKPKKDCTSVEVTFGKSATNSNQGPASIKSDQPKPNPAMSGIRQITKKEQL